MEKEEYMRQALELAEKAGAADEVPVGALIVNPENGEIICGAANRSAHGGNIADHAEMLAVRQACEKLGQTRLWGLDIYVTLEPCTMCAAVLSFARIHKVYFGAADEKGGAVVSGVRFYEAQSCHWRPEYEGGICENECAALLKSFFARKRVKTV